MSNIKNTLSFLINMVSTIVTNCTNAEDLLLATKASSTLLNTQTDNVTFQSITQSIDKINNEISTSGIISDSIKALFVLFDKVVKDSTAIIDIYMIAKSLKGLMENINDSIILIDSEKSLNQITILMEKSESLIDSMIAKVNALSSKIEDSESGYFASKLVNDINSIRNKTTDTQNHFNSIEQINSKLDSSINETRNDISALSSTINSVSTRLTDTANLLNQLINNKNNPTEVTKEQLGLEHALVAHKTDDLETNDSGSVHSAKATNEIWNKASEGIEDCPNDGKHYVRQNGKWVRGVVTDSVPIGSVMAYSGTKAPKGWLALESETIHSRNIFPDLYDHLKFYCSDLIIDSLSFRLCSGEGMFLRGLDITGKVDPDGAGRKMLSEQGDAIRNITGDGIMGGYTGALLPSITNYGCISKKISKQTFPNSANSAAIQYDFNASRVVPTSTENRPKNLNVLWIIKAFDCVNDPAIIEAESVVQQVSNNTVEIQRLEPIIKEIPNPNLLINGDFSVWQRGVEFAITSMEYTSDRWFIATTPPQNIIVQKNTIDQPGHILGDRYVRTCMTLIPSSTEDYLLRQTIENGTEKLHSRDVTVSFYLHANDTINGGVNISDLPNKSFIYTAGTWKKFEFTFKKLDLSSIKSDNVWLDIEFRGSPISIWGIKLELGNRATPFIPDNPATNLMKCQRYYIKSTQRIHAAYNTSTEYLGEIYHPVTMRTTPSIVLGPVEGAPVVIHSGLNNNTPYGFLIYSTSGYGFANGYTADAEL